MRQWLRSARAFDDVSENTLRPRFSQLALLFRGTLVEIVRNVFCILTRRSDP
jgi:hypothetical protein